MKIVKTYCIKYAPMGAGNAPKSKETIQTDKETHHEQIEEVLSIFKMRLTEIKLSFEDVIIYAIEETV